ncbi:hypothetical protein F5148DRAFT_1355083 [Russula earlei]|uniref:Uncharacterized protein n=1 Tax=Russula earlei TaxID=71964 RepID=A0ACC0UMW3_9AGAM|nr:hypothetical protein F5148DRAFT_1355083 [Russula earlei]
MSADSSDEDDDGSGLPASGLMAPWEVLHGLADVAIQRAAKASQCKHPFSLFHSYAAVVGEWQSKQTTKSHEVAFSRPQVKTSTIQKTKGPSDAMAPRILKFPDGMQNLL